MEANGVLYFSLRSDCSELPLNFSCIRQKLLRKPGFTWAEDECRERAGVNADRQKLQTICSSTSVLNETLCLFISSVSAHLKHDLMGLAKNTKNFLLPAFFFTFGGVI